MIARWPVILSLLIVASAPVYGLSGRSHEFSDSKCVLCHYDVKNDPKDIKPTVTLSCRACHVKLDQKRSHPSDVYPSMTVPQDMPLTDGKLTCLTCHYVHRRDNTLLSSEKDSFLRRQVKGIFFCTLCHKVNQNRHIVFENIHAGTFTESDRSSRIDRISLGCIECHDTHFKVPLNTPGAGTWNHYQREFNHIIGVPYKKLTARRMHEFTPEEMLGKEIRLFNGKIGCGTCHNIYSREKKLLAVNNNKSRLCLECHIK